MSAIVGLNGYNHNSSVALLADGCPRYAVEEERFDRRKYSDAFPARALANMQEQTGLAPADVDVVAFCWDWRHARGARLRYALRHGYDPVALRYSLGLDRPAKILKMMTLPARLRREGLGRARFAPVPHHLAHAASAFFSSPFDRAAVLTLDGLGEWETAWLGVGQGRELQPRHRLEFPQSLGLFYDTMCAFLGFRPREDAGKVMGLSAYGDPGRYAGVFRSIVSGSADAPLRIDTAFFDWERRHGNGTLYGPKLIAKLGPPRRVGEALEPRHHDIAAAAQACFEEAVLRLARGLAAQTGERRLCLAGGCALNCLANARLARETPFEEIFVFPAATDAGAGFGAAVYEAVRCGAPRVPLTSVLLGPEWRDAACLEALQRAGLAGTAPECLADAVAQELSCGAVVGWYQGRMEFGPRALGSRSILCDPRRADAKDLLNARVKHREAFRPYAPSCTAEDAARVFDAPRASPWMLFTVPVREDWRPRLPAITHADGTARLQTVARAEQPLFHALLTAFARRTGVPVLLNTSFNISGQPVVCTPADAVDCFLRTGLDVLALGPYLVKKDAWARAHTGRDYGAAVAAASP